MADAPAPPSPPPDPSRRQLVGKAIDVLGQVMLPGAIGAAAGYYASDQGVRLLPDMLELLTGVGILGVVLIVSGKALRGRAWVDTKQGLKMRRRVIFVLVLAVLAMGLRLGTWYAERPSPLTAMLHDAEDPQALSRAFMLDAQRYRELDQTMERVLRDLEAAPWLGPDGSDDVLTADQEAVLLDSFEILWNATVELDEIRGFYEDWYRFDPSRIERAWHLRSFLLTFGAELSVHEKAARFSRLVLPNGNARKYLDAERADRGLPKTAFSIYRQELLGTRDQARVVAGDQYLDVLERTVKGRQEAATLGLTWLWERCEDHLETLALVAPIDRAALLARADSQVLKRNLKRVWYPTQKGVAEAMGDTRAQRVGWYLIPECQQDEVVARSQPGDVMLARKNWYLSNVGLPGFWPHAILFMGTPQQLAEWGDDPEIRAWILQETGAELDLVSFLARRYPAAWARYVAVDDDGHPNVVIEAVSEGVTFSTMDHCAGDYLAVLRPRLSKLAKAQAIAESLTHLDKPYDFDFDFATDAALVCTELVFRSYRPDDGKEGIELPLVDVAGRRTLPANELARLYAQQVGQEDRAFDFVAFVDASERERTTWLSDEAAFIASHTRSKLDVATGMMPEGIERVCTDEELAEVGRP